MSASSSPRKSTHAVIQLNMEHETDVLRKPTTAFGQDIQVGLEVF